MPSLLKAEETPAKKLIGVSPDYKERDEHRPKPGITNTVPLRQKSCKVLVYKLLLRVNNLTDIPSALIQRHLSNAEQ